MSHTPGPWKWLPNEGQFIVNEAGDIIAEVPCQGANADDGPVIAAAPDLLEALEWVMQTGLLRYTARISGQNETWCDAVDRAHAAIKKARGK